MLIHSIQNCGKRQSETKQEPATSVLLNFFRKGGRRSLLIAENHPSHTYRYIDAHTCAHTQQHHHRHEQQQHHQRQQH